MQYFCDFPEGETVAPSHIDNVHMENYKLQNAIFHDPHSYIL